MSVVTGRLAYDDPVALPDDGKRHELIDGALIVVAAPSPKHQKLGHRLAVRFDRAVVEPGLGNVYAAPLDVRLSPRDVVQPDLIVVLRDRAQIVAETLIEGAPDLVVEILSPSSRGRDREAKARLYARAGVREYWVVDPEARAITVLANPAGERYETTRQAAGRAQSVIWPGLAIELDALVARMASDDTRRDATARVIDHVR